MLISISKTSTHGHAATNQRSSWTLFLIIFLIQTIYQSSTALRFAITGLGPRSYAPMMKVSHLYCVRWHEPLPSKLDQERNPINISCSAYNTCCLLTRHGESNSLYRDISTRNQVPVTSQPVLNSPMLVIPSRTSIQSRSSISI